MDTDDLTHALREATAGLEPPAGFTDAVVDRGRRRRTRNRLTVATAAAGVAVVATTIALTGAYPLSAPPPTGDSIAVPKADWRLRHSAGGHIHDPFRLTEIVETWIAGLRGGGGGPVHESVSYAEHLGDPHVYWAGETPYGEAALVVQNVRLPADDRVPPDRRGRQRVATGLVAAMPGSPEPRLLGVQFDNPGTMGYFLLPDDRTLLAVAAPEQALWLSEGISHDQGVSRRAWTRVPVRDGVGLARIAEDANPLNVRLVAGGPDAPPRPEQMKPGGHLPLLRTAGYPRAPSGPADRGLDRTGTKTYGEPRTLPRPPAELFADAMRDSGLLDPSSFTPRTPEWAIVVGLPDERTVIISEWQELDYPARMYQVVVADDGRTVLDVLHGFEVTTSAPGTQRLAGGQTYGTLVYAPNRLLSYRLVPGGPWSEPVPDVLVVPPDAAMARVDDGEIVPLS